MRYWDHGHMDAGWGIAMLLVMLVFWALIAALVVWVVRTSRGPHLPTGLPSNPEQILAERLARGEIEVAEYETRLAALKRPR